MHGTVRDVYHRVRGVYRTHGIETALRRGLEHVLFDSSFTTTTGKSIYWRVAPSYYRWQYPTDFEDLSDPPDPFKRVPVHPKQIRRFTARWYPPWRHRGQLFGSVKPGRWDQRSPVNAPTDGGPPKELFVGERLTDSPLYQAMERHFLDDVPWTETRFIQGVLAYLRDGEDLVWHDCRTRVDVIDRCAYLDDLYRSLSRRGCLSYIERTPPREREKDFISALENEITVDVGRDGELLLVSGKHRLVMAQLLDLEEVPVVFLVRHAEWIQKRRNILNGAEPFERHPDLQDISPDHLVGPSQ